MFNLKVDEEIHLRSFHPDDTEAFFNLIERNRARLRPWIAPSSLPETAKDTRAFTVRCLFNYYGDQTGPSELDQYYSELESYFPPAHLAAEAIGSRHLLWQILAALAGVESDNGKSAALKSQAREIIQFIADHIHEDAMRSQFLQSENVSAIIA
jgi:hypothetical protein